MKRHLQTGSVVLPAILGLMVVLLLFALGFGFWAYQGRQDYKNNVDQKISAAVADAKQAEDVVKDTQFTEQAKNPLRTYSGPAAYGSVVVMYPKSWSGYVRDDSTSSPFVDAYFAPGTVPDVEGNDSIFALHVMVVSQSYSQELASYQSDVQQHTVSVKAYKLPKVPSVVGSMLTGKVGDNDKVGTVVLLPIRDKTLVISTDSNQYLPDFRKHILPNITFSP